MRRLRVELDICSGIREEGRIEKEEVLEIGREGKSVCTERDRESKADSDSVCA